MFRTTLARLILFALSGAMVVHAQMRPAQHHPVLMISIDGMRPDYVTDAAKHGLHLPVLCSFLHDGAFAEAVLNVQPTFTYPNHTTLVTGVLPAKHGIFNNKLFDPTGKEQGGWYWYGRQVRVMTLWQAAHSAGLSTASVYWPVTVDSDGIDFNIPEYFRQRTPQDRYLEEALTQPRGLLEELEQQTGPFDIRNSDITFDETVTRTAIALIAYKHPDFMTIHIVSLDHQEHLHGPFSPEADADIQQIDPMIGRLMVAERRAHPDAVIAIVSDHGFAAIQQRVHLNAAFVKAGLIILAPEPKPTVASWKAYTWAASGSAAVILHDREDNTVLRQTGSLLHKLAADPRNGIARVLDHDDAVRAGSRGDTAFLVDFRPGYSVDEALDGPLVENIAPAGTHGYMPYHPEMHSSFIIAGPGIAPGKDLGTIDMRQIAPTLARELGFSLPSAEMQPLQLRP